MDLLETLRARRLARAQTVDLEGVGSVRLAPITGAGLQAFAKAQEADAFLAVATLLVYSWVDADGARVWADDQAATLLDAIDREALEALQAVALEVNGLAGAPGPKG